MRLMNGQALAQEKSTPSYCLHLLDDFSVGSELLLRLRQFDVIGVIRLTAEYLTDEEIRAQRKIVYFYNEGEYDCAIQHIRTYLEKYEIEDDNYFIYLYKALSHQRLEQTEGAIAAYETALPFIKRMDNVQRGRYAYVFFNLGQLLHTQGNTDSALLQLEEALIHHPQNFYYQIVMGDVYREAGMEDAALTHFNEILDSPDLTEEQRVVIDIKKGKIKSYLQASFGETLDTSQLRIHDRFSLKIQPINYVDPLINLDAICSLLQSKYLLECEVLPPMALPEEKILDEHRDQYNADRIMDELRPRFPSTKKRNYYVLAITGKDIFGGKSNYVFSWQDGSWGVGVVSSHRFVARLDDFYEKNIIATRRLGIQFLSTTGSMLGFKRASKSHCPMAYPDSLGDFLKKGSKLCQSTIQQRDDWLKKWGTLKRKASSKRAEEIRDVYNTYYFKPN